MMDKIPKRTLCQLTSVVQCSPVTISWPLKMGLISCPKMLVKYYHSMLCSISEECRSLMTIWWCGPWFGSAWFSSVWSSSKFHKQI